MTDTPDRILDAAGRVFMARGVHAADMGDIAAEAGCSRATIYRWFENRNTLRVAWIHRAARRVYERVQAEVGNHAEHHDDPAAYLVESVTTALRIVRSEPALAAWLTPEGSGMAARLAGQSDIIAGLVGVLNEDGVPGPEARWLVRIILSLLTHPGGDEAAERELIERFVVPPMLGTGPGPPG